MVDISGVPPAYLGNMVFHGATDPAATKTNTVTPSDAGASLSGRSMSEQSHSFYGRSKTANTNAPPEEAKAEPDHVMPDENTPAGPPPAFSISILERERVLEQSLARINAQQSLSRDVAAVSPELREASRDKTVETPVDQAGLAPLNLAAPAARGTPTDMGQIEGTKQATELPAAQKAAQEQLAKAAAKEANVQKAAEQASVTAPEPDYVPDRPELAKGR